MTQLKTQNAVILHEENLGSFGTRKKTWVVSKWKTLLISEKKMRNGTFFEWMFAEQLQELGKRRTCDLFHCCRRIQKQEARRQNDLMSMSCRWQWGDAWQTEVRVITNHCWLSAIWEEQLCRRIVCAYITWWEDTCVLALVLLLCSLTHTCTHTHIYMHI